MAFWTRSPDPRAALRKLIGDYELPSFSASAVSTLILLRDGRDKHEIAERMMADPGLTVRILRTVNSVGFGLRHEVTNLVSAANLMGRSRLESLVLTAAVSESLPAPNGIDMVGFWRTSAHRACLARQLAKNVHPSQGVEAFTAGLLQDMAAPILATAHPDRYPDVYRTAQSDPEIPLHVIEQETFGYDHAQIGALMAEAWSLPETLLSAIAEHHVPGADALQAVVAVSHIRHCDPPDELLVLRAHCGDTLRIEATDLESMIEVAGAEATALAESMSPGARV